MDDNGRDKTIDQEIVNSLEILEDQETVDKVRGILSIVFRDKLTRQQAMLLNVTSVQLDMLQGLVDLADRTIKAIQSSEHFEADLKDMELMEQNKLLTNLIRGMATLSMSLDSNKNTAALLEEMRRTLQAPNIQKLDAGVRGALAWVVDSIKEAGKIEDIDSDED
jgi:hypothetical protein